MLPVPTNLIAPVSVISFYVIPLVWTSDLFFYFLDLVLIKYVIQIRELYPRNRGFILYWNISTSHDCSGSLLRCFFSVMAKALHMPSYFPFVEPSV